MVNLEVISSSTSVGLFLAWRHANMLGYCHISSWRGRASLVGICVRRETILLFFRKQKY